MRELPSLLIIGSMRLMGVGEGKGAKEKAWRRRRDELWSVPPRSPGSSQQSDADIHLCIFMVNWPYCSCFTREENGSREGKEFIHFLSQGHVRRGCAPIGLCAEVLTLPHSNPIGSPEHKLQSIALSKPLPESSLVQTQSRLGTRA